MQWIASMNSFSSAGFLEDLGTPPDGADVVELRLDLLPAADVATAVASTPLPVLATLRSKAEGGQGPDDPGDRGSILRRAVEGGAHLVDLEWARDRNLIHELGLPPERVVLSWHDTERTPENLTEIAAAMLAEPVALAKIVPTARSLGDLERILSLSTPLATREKRDRYRLIAFAMGSIGAASRYLAPLLGAPIGFAAWSADAPAAPGQQTPGRMNAAVGHLNGPPRRLFGVVGADVSKSLSPTLHGAAFAASGIPDVMLPISVPDPDELVQLFTPFGKTLFDRLGLPAYGWAVTTPYKIMAAEMATENAPRVQRAGAANTLLLKPDRIIAENTDADGVVGSLTAAGVNPVGATVLVEGAGGAARGAAVGLHLAGAEVVLRSRDADTAREVADSLGLGWCDPDDRAGAEILVNATPLGHNDDDALAFHQSEIGMAGAIVDMVYRDDRKTALVTAAEDAGTVVIDGLRMLAFQGMAQFAAFTTSPPPREEMLRSVAR
ncbi:MAG: type I 3-dehydroquinate dehydratase [Acidobacteriota bacterium]